MPREIRTPGLIFEASELDLAALPPVDAHVHTSFTDGAAGVEETHRRAVEAGLIAVGFSEHSRKTSTDWFPTFAAQVRALPETPCRAYVGTEVKVESCDGTIDTTPTITELCDFVMASVHRFPGPDGDPIAFSDVAPADAVAREYELAWAAMANPRVDVLGHMFGMSYRRFEVVPPAAKIKELLARAAEFGVAVEINSYYHPNPYELLEWACEAGARIAFGSNAHSLAEVGSIVRRLEQERPA